MKFRGIKGLLGYVWNGGEQRGVGNLENPSTSLSDPEPWLIAALGGGEPHLSGLTVTPQMAMKLSAVYSCVRNVSEDFASLPLHVFRKDYERATDHPVYELLHSNPNPLQTSYTWREMGQAHVELHGNWYNEIEYSRGGQPIGLWPIPPNVCNPRLTADKRDVLYDVQLPDGSRVTLPSWKVLHVPGLHYDGIRGTSRIRAAANAIGLGVAAESFGAAFFGNSARPSGYIKVPPTVKASSGPEILKKWNESNQGLSNASRTALLMQGAEWQKIALTAEEAQFIETRKLQRSEIAAFWRMPPHMIGDLDKATFSNIEHQVLQYITFTLRPICVRFEQEVKRKLLNEDDADLRASVRLNGLMRGDAASRSRYYATGRQWGWLCVDDIRELEEMPPLPDKAGQVFLQPSNMMDPANPSEPVNNGATGGMGGDPANEPTGADTKE